MTVKIGQNVNALATTMAAAMRSGDEQEQAAAWEQFHQSLVERMAADFEEARAAQDASVLAQRGYRQLTAAENKWYQRLAEAMRSKNPQQSFVDIIGEDVEGDLMPETILEDVYRDLQQESPLLERVNFTYVKYATKWVLNDHTTQKAVWGKITDAISKEITSAFKVVDVHQNKLSAFAFVELDMLDLGPTFLDAYVRLVLGIAILLGLEYGIVKGNGVDEPIGVIRDIHEGVQFSTTDGYPEKEKVVVTEITPTTYGALLEPLAKTEDGKPRKFTEVQLLVNQHDYLTKVMPATTFLVDGSYVRDIFPFPTEIIVTNELSDGEAVVGLLDQYNAFAGGSRNGTVEFSDEFKFLDDVRYFKVVQHATGRATDDTCFQHLDISGLKPAYPTVNAIVSSEVKTTAETTSDEDPTA